MTATSRLIPSSLARSPRRVGDFEPVPGKTCRECGKRGEWPGQPCPDCKPSLSEPAPPEPSPVPSLAHLAATVNSEHDAMRRAGASMLEHAIAAGEALLAAQALVERGEWIAWFRENIRADLSTCYRYMRLAEHKDAVRRSQADSITAAMRVLADVPRRGHGPRGYTDADKRDWLKLADEIGIKPAARALGIAPSTIHRWASPSSPSRGLTKVSREVTEERIERLASWLVERFGGYDYPERVTPDVRVDAATALARIFAEGDARECS